MRLDSQKIDEITLEIHKTIIDKSH